MDINYFLPGQLWLYDARASEPDSSLTILKIDDLEEDVIVHVRIDNVRLNDTLGYVAHLPFSADVLWESLTAFVKHLENVPDFAEEYQRWKGKFDSGTTSYLKVPVKEVLKGIEENQNNKAI